MPESFSLICSSRDRTGTAEDLRSLAVKSACGEVDEGRP
ncbi:MAG: hypothetical protein QOD04_3082 [Pseudonocardiales bacterium]|nr:hypothetical protein [Pseudonocardiales bacterium]